MNAHTYPQLTADLNGKTFDYIICGAGSAGCVIAARLSEDPAVSVLLVEAGHGDTPDMVSTPLRVIDIWFSDYDDLAPRPINMPETAKFIGRGARSWVAVRR